MKNSGAMIAWNFLHGKEEPPSIIRYIEDRDLWKFELENTRPIIANLFSYKLTIEFMADLLNKTEEELEVFVIEGKAIERKYQVDLQKIFKSNRRTIQIAGISVEACNAPPMFASDLGNMLAEQSFGTFGVTYHDNKYKRLFSLRSIEGGMDVSKIAELYDGGGHARAAGFGVPRDHFLAQI
jgi:nanoRNase/pAp phosphatase (c-di-AMP/oligoRNAs hydrolase)